MEDPSSSSSLLLEMVDGGNVSKNIYLHGKWSRRNGLSMIGQQCIVIEGHLSLSLIPPGMREREREREINVSRGEKGQSSISCPRIASKSPQKQIIGKLLKRKITSEIFYIYERISDFKRFFKG